MSADDNHVTTQGYKSQLRGYLILGDERKQSADRLKSINVHEPSAVMKWEKIPQILDGTQLHR